MSNATVAVGGNIGRRRTVLAKTCDVHEGHEHNYDHLTLVVCGGIRVSIREAADGPVVSETEHWPGDDPIHIAANRHHTIKALADNTVYFCLFSHRDFGGIVSQQYVGNSAAYH